MEGDLLPVPKSVRVAVIGSGYAGLSTALELHRLGVEAVVIEAREAGFGASTRNAGFVCSHGNLSPRYAGKSIDLGAERRRHAEALEGVSHLESVIETLGISCHWVESGHVTLAWTPAHHRAMAAKVAHLNRMGEWGASLLTREEARAELATDFYSGGMLIARSGLLHPSLYYRGLLDACRARGIPVCTRAPVTGLKQAGRRWRLATGRGECETDQVIVATNGYTGEAMGSFHRRVVPIGSYIVATEEIGEHAVRSIIPNGRSVYDSRRVLSYCRPSPDGRRFLFGGRVRFGLDAPAATALPLHDLMIERFPQLAGVRITHAWTGNLGFTFDEAPHVGTLEGLHFALGCNGTGIAMMTWLGMKIARRIARANDAESVFGEAPLPTHPLYRGNPWFVPAVGYYFKARDTLDRLLAR
ncbi:MAG: NAD(P)/FAD-dependent oxidoreductase [Parvibaculaceae bacterium]